MTDMERAFEMWKEEKGIQDFDTIFIAEDAFTFAWNYKQPDIEILRNDYHEAIRRLKKLRSRLKEHREMIEAIPIVKHWLENCANSPENESWEKSKPD